MAITRGVSRLIAEQITPETNVVWHRLEPIPGLFLCRDELKRRIDRAKVQIVRTTVECVFH